MGVLKRENGTVAALRVRPPRGVGGGGERRRPMRPREGADEGAAPVDAAPVDEEHVWLAMLPSDARSVLDRVRRCEIALEDPGEAHEELAVSGYDPEAFSGAGWSMVDAAVGWLDPSVGIVAVILGPWRWLEHASALAQFGGRCAVRRAFVASTSLVRMALRARGIPEGSVRGGMAALEAARHAHLVPWEKRLREPWVHSSWHLAWRRGAAALALRSMHDLISTLPIQWGWTVATIWAEARLLPSVPESAQIALARHHAVRLGIVRTSAAVRGELEAQVPDAERMLWRRATLRVFLRAVRVALTVGSVETLADLVLTASDLMLVSPLPAADGMEWRDVWAGAGSRTQESFRSSDTAGALWTAAGRPAPQPTWLRTTWARLAALLCLYWVPI